MPVRLGIALGTIVLLTGFAPVPLPKPRKLDAAELLKQLQGTWEIMPESRVQQAQANNVRRLVQIQGQQWATWSARGDIEPRRSTIYKMQLDTSGPAIKMDLIRELRTVKKIDAVRDPGPLASRAQLGILTLEGDVLRWSYVTEGRGLERPSNHDDPNAVRMTLRRVKP